ncbi:MAG: hypothetical protein WA803_04910, partial [Steroidobacteraceae bacterium]
MKAGLWVRRARLAIVAPDLRHSRRSQADFPLIGLSEFARPPLSIAGVPPKPVDQQQACRTPRGRKIAKDRAEHLLRDRT